MFVGEDTLLTGCDLVVRGLNLLSAFLVLLTSFDDRIEDTGSFILIVTLNYCTKLSVSVWIRRCLTWFREYYSIRRISYVSTIGCFFFDILIFLVSGRCIVKISTDSLRLCSGLWTALCKTLCNGLCNGLWTALCKTLCNGLCNGL